MPIGVWSTSSTRPHAPPSPRIAPAAAQARAAAARRPPRRRRAAARRLSCSTSRTSVLLPLPLTPVTHTSRPSGIAHVEILAGCAARARALEHGVRRGAGRRRRRRAPRSGCRSGSRRNRPVTESGSRMTAATVPSATSRPPFTPAAGAEVDHVLGPADGLLVVLDHDHRVALVLEAAQRVEQHAGCRARAGRWSARRGCSRRPRRLEPSCAASRMRCASPPLSVGAARSSAR